MEFHREQLDLSPAVAGHFEPQRAASACQRRSCLLGISGFFHFHAAFRYTYRSAPAAMSQPRAALPTDHERERSW